MKAITQQRYGGAEVLHLQDVPTPEPGRGQVLVRVEATALDPGVRHLMTGLPYAARLASGLRRPRQRVPGMDLAGVVHSIGPDVSLFAPGDRVYGSSTGTFAEFAVVVEDALCVIPAALGFTEAAAVPVSGQTALKAVRTAGKVRAGQRVLVIGATGGVGAFAVQIAAADGAEVTAVCSGATADRARSLGATEVIDYRREGVADRGRIYDVVIDTGGNRTLAELRRAVRPRGVVVLVGGEQTTGRWFQGFDRQLRALLLSPFVGPKLVPLLSLNSAANLRVLGDMINAGTITVPVDRTFALTELEAALTHLATRNRSGKVVITP